MKKEILNEVKHSQKTISRFQKLAGLNEDMESTSFLPMTYKGEDRADFNWENVIKNIINNKSKIANDLGIESKDELNDLLFFYLDGLLEMEYGGDADVYDNTTLQEFVDEIKLLYTDVFQDEEVDSADNEKFVSSHISSDAIPLLQQMKQA